MMGTPCKYVARVCPFLLALAWTQVGVAQEHTVSPPTAPIQSDHVSQAMARLRALNLIVSGESIATLMR